MPLGSFPHSLPIAPASFRNSPEFIPSFPTYRTSKFSHFPCKFSQFPWVHSLIPYLSHQQVFTIHLGSFPHSLPIAPASFRNSPGLIPSFPTHRTSNFSQFPGLDSIPHSLRIAPASFRNSPGFIPSFPTYRTSKFSQFAWVHSLIPYLSHQQVFAIPMQVFAIPLGSFSHSPPIAPASSRHSPGFIPPFPTYAPARFRNSPGLIPSFPVYRTSKCSQFSKVHSLIPYRTSKFSQFPCKYSKFPWVHSLIPYLSHQQVFAIPRPGFIPSFPIAPASFRNSPGFIPSFPTYRTRVHSLIPYLSHQQVFAMSLGSFHHSLPIAPASLRNSPRFIPYSLAIAPASSRNPPGFIPSFPTHRSIKFSQFPCKFSKFPWVHSLIPYLSHRQVFAIPLGSFPHSLPIAPASFCNSPGFIPSFPTYRTSKFSQFPWVHSLIPYLSHQQVFAIPLGSFPHSLPIAPASFRNFPGFILSFPTYRTSKSSQFPSVHSLIPYLSHKQVFAIPWVHSLIPYPSHQQFFTIPRPGFISSFPTYRTSKFSQFPWVHSLIPYLSHKQVFAIPWVHSLIPYPSHQQVFAIPLGSFPHSLPIAPASFCNSPGFIPSFSTYRTSKFSQFPWVHSLIPYLSHQQVFAIPLGSFPHSQPIAASFRPSPL